jgi:hypothetical protein
MRSGPHSNGKSFNRIWATQLNIDDSPTVNHRPMVPLTDELKSDRLDQPWAGVAPL